MGTSQRSRSVGRRTVLKGSATIAAVQLETSPPEFALQPGTPEFRSGDRELMSTVFVGEAHSPRGDPDNMFTVRNPVPAEKAAGPAADTGCKLHWPA
jgi:hypothetical protein